MPELRQTPEFDTPERTERLQLVAHLLRNTDAITWVRGPAGAGKTRLLDRLAAELGEEAPVLRLDGDGADPPAAVCDALGLPVAYWPSLGEQQGMAAVFVLVDDADRLNPTAIAELQALAQAGGRVVLAAASLPEGAWQGGAMQAVDLPPLTLEQARAFLAVAGHDEVAVWDEQRIHALYQQAGGQPGALLDAVAQGDPAPASPGTWKWVLGSVVALAVVLTLWQQDRINALFAPAVEPEPAAADVSLPSEPEAAPPARVAKESANEIPIPPLPVAPVTPAVESVAEPESVTPASEQAGAQQPPPAPPVMAAEPATPDPEMPPEPARPVEPASQPAAPAVPAAEVPPMSPEPAPASAADTAAAPVAEAEPVEPAEPKDAVKPATPPAAPEPAGQAQRMSWLRTRTPQHYTLQLTGARDRGTIEAFVRRHGLSGNYVVFARDLDGKPWYSLIYGDFPDRAAALRAKLPSALSKAKPWPRTFASVWEQLPPDQRP